MTGTIRIAIIAALSLIASLELPRTVDALASNGGVLYLRAQYKLLTGDTGSALRLMRQAVEASRRNGSSTAPSPAHPTNACTRTDADVSVASL